MNSNPQDKQVSVEEIIAAHHVLKDVINRTPLQRDVLLSTKYNCNVFLKREDLQVVRSFKIRGSYNLIQGLAPEQLQHGIVCASAGNHAQGVAYSCNALHIHGKIYMPTTTPRQKITQVEMFGGSYVDIILSGDTFDDAFHAAKQCSEQMGMTFVHPFDDPKIIAGNGTIGAEILERMDAEPDYVFVTIGGGGLAAGVGTYMKAIHPAMKVIGVEPEGAASMKQSFDHNRVVALDQIDTFVDGAAVKKVGELTYRICREVIDDVVLVPEGKVCTTILELYNRNAIVAEPAGALTIAALDAYKEQIEGKNVVCVISGGNNDIDRMQEMKERSLIYEGLKHYFTVNFPQRSGALREFLDDVLGPNDDITRFEYTKKHNKDNGPALVGIELKNKEDYEPLIARMQDKKIIYTEINKDRTLYNLLI
jgi:threonine dehydratase